MLRYTRLHPGDSDFNKHAMFSKYSTNMNHCTTHMQSFKGDSFHVNSRFNFTMGRKKYVEGVLK